MRLISLKEDLDSVLSVSPLPPTGAKHASAPASPITTFPEKTVRSRISHHHLSRKNALPHLPSPSFQKKPCAPASPITTFPEKTNQTCGETEKIAGGRAVRRGRAQCVEGKSAEAERLSARIGPRRGGTAGGGRENYGRSQRDGAGGGRVRVSLEREYRIYSRTGRDDVYAMGTRMVFSTGHSSEEIRVASEERGSSWRRASFVSRRKKLPDTGSSSLLVII